MSRFFRFIKTVLDSVADVISPRVCVVCGSVLGDEEKCVCPSCMEKAIYTDYAFIPSNPMEIRVEELTGVKVVAMSLMVYMHEGISGKCVSAFKYHGRKDVALLAGSLMGKEILKSDRFKGFDVFIPIPLHVKRQKKRGYNQSELLCQGISGQAGGHIVSAIVRTVNTQAQAHLTRSERWANARSIFSLAPNADVTGKNVVIVDDVFTTGATVSEAVKVLINAGASKVAVMTLAAGE